MSHRQHRESTKDDWQTPADLFKKLNSRFKFTGDACASDDNHLCDNFFTIDDSALEASWSELGPRVFINPPYSMTSTFMGRCWGALRDRQVELVVAVVPSTCEVKWFHKYVLGKASEVWFTKGRVDFVNPDTQMSANGNVVGTAIIVWDGYTSHHRQTRFFGICGKTFTPTETVGAAVWYGDQQVEMFA